MELRGNTTKKPGAFAVCAHHAADLLLHAYRILIDTTLSSLRIGFFIVNRKPTMDSWLLNELMYVIMAYLIHIILYILSRP